MDTEIFKDYNAQIFNEYKSNRINQHSVGMQYVKIDLAVNDEEYENEYKVVISVCPTIYHEFLKRLRNLVSPWECS